MIIDDKDAVSRLNSPLNLINRLRRADGRKSAMSLFGLNKDSNGEVKKEIKVVFKKEDSFNPFSDKQEDKIDKPKEEPQPLAVTSHSPISSQPSTTLDKILENNDSQIKLGLAHDNALALLNNSVSLLATKLDDVKADKLPSVVAAASKVVESIRRERSEASKNNKDREVHYHFYTPQQKSISDYEVIDVGVVEQ